MDHRTALQNGTISFIILRPASRGFILVLLIFGCIIDFLCGLGGHNDKYHPPSTIRRDGYHSYGGMGLVVVVVRHEA
jgi:hypothetical protein